MAVMYRITAKKKLGNLASGMWIEVVFKNSSSIPMQKDIIDGFNTKYGANTLTGTINKSFLDIVKL